MEASSRADDFIAVGLASLEIEADEIELAVMHAAHQLFWPPIRELLERDFADVPPEPRQDLSRAPEEP